MNSLTKLALGAACTLSCILTGCTTIPLVAEPTGPSYHGTNLNSGFIAFLPNGRSLVDPATRNTYNALVDRYGMRFAPPIQHDGLEENPAGLIETPAGWEIDPECLGHLARMKYWHRQEIPK